MDVLCTFSDRDVYVKVNVPIKGFSDKIRMEGFVDCPYLKCQRMSSFDYIPFSKTTWQFLLVDYMLLIFDNNTIITIV